MNRSVAAESRHHPSQSAPSVSDISSELDISRSGTQQSAASRKHLRMWLLLVLVLPLLGMAPLLVLQAQSLMQQPRSFFFPVPILIGAWLLFRTGGYGIANGLRANCANGLGIIGLLIAVVGTYFFSPWIVQFASVIVVFAWALGAFAGAHWTRIFAICCLFAVAVPAPGGLDTALNTRLQAVSCWGCNGFLDAIGVPNIVEGNLMQIAENKVKLSEVSGGADSFAALLAIGVSIVVLRHSKFLVGLATIAAVPLCYVLCNLVRLLTVAFGFEYFSTDLTTGSGYIVAATGIFLLSVVCLWLSHVSITALLEPISLGKGANNLTALYRLLTSWPDTRQWAPQIEKDSVQPATPLSGIRKPTIAFLSAGCVLIGALAAFVSLNSARQTLTSISMSPEQAAMLPSQNTFQGPIGNLRLTGFTPTDHKTTSPVGRYSNMWKFDDKGTQVFVTLDFPYQGWRPIWAGYQANGWKVLSTKPVELPAGAGDSNWYVEEFEMQNQYGLFGFVWYAFFDEQALPASKESENGTGRVSILTRLQKKPAANAKKHFQVQMFLESGKELTERETQSNREIFFQVFERIRQQSEAAMKRAN